MMIGSAAFLVVTQPAFCCGWVSVTPLQKSFCCSYFILISYIKGSVFGRKYVWKPQCLMKKEWLRSGWLSWKLWVCWTAKALQGSQDVIKLLSGIPGAKSGKVRAASLTPTDVKYFWGSGDLEALIAIIMELLWGWKWYAFHSSPVMLKTEDGISLWHVLFFCKSVFTEAMEKFGLR